MGERPAETETVQSLADLKLEEHPDLQMGQLDNGLKYVILPNKVPLNRFEAHLEMHAGIFLGWIGVVQECLEFGEVFRVGGAPGGAAVGACA